jgi:hypothetical protein
MGNIVSRIGQFIENQGMSVRAFEMSIGASDGLRRRAINNNSDIQSKWIEKICEEYPSVSPEWLLTGNGEMLKVRAVDRMAEYILAMGDEVERVDKKLWKPDILLKLLGIKTSFFKYYKKHPEKDANFRALNHFMKEYAFDVNPTWLFTGSGAMMKTEDEKKCKNCEDLIKRNTILEYQLEQAKKKK